MSSYKSKGYGMYKKSQAYAKRRNEVQSLMNFAARRRRSAILRSNMRTGGLMNLEMKHFDSGVSSTSLVAGVTSGEMDPTSLDCLNCPAQGDNNSERIGNKITIKKITVRGFLTRGGSTVAVGNPMPLSIKCVVALVLDKQTNGAQLNAENVYLPTGSLTGSTTNMLRDPEFLERFQVLRQFVYVLPAGSAAQDTAGGNIQSGGTGTHFDFFVDKLNIPVRFNGTTSVVGSIVNNSLHIIAFADKGSGINVATIDYNARITYTDG